MAYLTKLKGSPASIPPRPSFIEISFISFGAFLAAMQYLRVSHPPVGSNPFIVFLLGANWDYLWMPSLIGSLLIVLLAIIYNNISKTQSYPKYW
jgi:CBS-domain-containing membrane protein